MSIANDPTDVIYPESDGKPVGETDIHIDWIFRLRDILKTRYRNQEVYVAADLLVYYNEGVPRDFFVPDVFVVTNCPTHMRRVYKIWEEPSPPEVIIEVTSKSSRRQDEVVKPAIYAEVGVKEYFAFDPTADYMEPPLQGFRRTEGGYEQIEPDANGVLRCETLNIHLSLNDLDLVLRDGTSGEELLTGMALAEKRRAEELAAADRKRTEELAAADRKRTEELAAADRKRTEELAAADRKRTEELAAAERKRTEELAAADRKRTEEVEAAERKRIEELNAAERKRTEDIAQLEAEIKRLRERLGE